MRLNSKLCLNINLCCRLFKTNQKWTHYVKNLIPASGRKTNWIGINSSLSPNFISHLQIPVDSIII